MWNLHHRWTPLIKVRMRTPMQSILDAELVRFVINGTATCVNLNIEQSVRLRLQQSCARCATAGETTTDPYTERRFDLPRGNFAQPNLNKQCFQRTHGRVTHGRSHPTLQIDEWSTHRASEVT